MMPDSRSNISVFQSPSNIIPFPAQQCPSIMPAGCPMSPVISSQGTAIDDLEKWQMKQNGSLGRIEEKVDKLGQRMEDKFATLMYWMLGLSASLVTAMIGVLLKLVLAA